MDSPPGVAFFTLNGSWLGLYPRDSLAEGAMVSPKGSGFALARNVPTEPEVDQVIEQAVSAEATLVKQPHKVFGGRILRLI